MSLHSHEKRFLALKKDHFHCQDAKIAKFVTCRQRRLFYGGAGSGGSPAPALCFGLVLSVQDSAQDKVLFQAGAALYGEN